MPIDPQHWNIPEIVAAVIADDPDAAQLADSLPQSLEQIQAGQYSVAYAPANHEQEA